MSSWRKRGHFDVHTSSLEPAIGMAAAKQLMFWRKWIYREKKVSV